MKTTEFSNQISIYAASMGKIFRVTHICGTMKEVNAICERDRSTALIASAGDDCHLLAKQYGSVCPSAIMEDIQRNYREKNGSGT